MPAPQLLAQPLQPGGRVYGCHASSKGNPSPSLRDTQCLTWDRLFKFPQMDFEMAVWEMTSLLIAPKKVFKSIYYHVSGIGRTLASSRAN